MQVVEVTGDVGEHVPGADVDLTPVARAGPGRRAEYRTGRWCARQALDRLGVPGATSAPLPPGPHRAPSWPDGVVGSITHCTGYRAAAAAFRTGFRALGIDVTADHALPPRVLDVLLVPGERGALTRAAVELPGHHVDRILFSAKESLVKAWSGRPGFRGFTGFRVELADGVFTAHALGTQEVVRGRWGVAGGFLATCVVVPATAGPSRDR